jgi:hypothetical protein
MIDLTLTSEIVNQLKAEFPECYVGSPLDITTIVLPAILLEIRSSAVVGSPLQLGDLSVMCESSADDTSKEDHAARVEAVDAFMRGIFVDADAVKLAGIVAKDFENRPTDRHWVTSLSYTVGFEKVS